MDSRDPLFLLDVALRGAAVALFVVIAVATLRRGGNRPLPMASVLNSQTAIDGAYAGSGAARVRQ